MPITLDQVLATPADQDELYQHMLKIGAIIPPPAPAPVKVPEMQPAAATPRIPDLSQPAVPLDPNSRPHMPAAAAPKPAPINPGNVPDGVTATAPMAPPDHVLPHLDYRGRQNLPTTDADTQVGSKNFYDNQEARMRDQNANHWGTPESSHPGVIGKVGHILGKIGNVAGDILAPATTALIPGTDLNRRGQMAELQRLGAGAQTRETAEEAVHQRPEIAEATGAMRERIEEARENAALEKERLGDTSKEKVGAGHDTARTDAADTTAGSRTDVANINADSREKIAGLGKSDFDKYYHAQLSEGMPDTASNRLRAHKAWDAATKDPSGGTFIPMYAPDGSVVGAWNPSKGIGAKVPEAFAGANTGQGAGIQGKQETRFDKERKGYQNVLDHTAMADQAAINPTGPGDYTILMSFVNNTKPDTGFRFTEAERKMILEAQSLANQVEANYDKVTRGAFLSSDQRQQMLDIIHNSAQQAKANLQHLDAGRVHPSPGSDNFSGAPAGKTFVYDPQGTRHSANSTTLKQMLADPKYKGWSTSKPNGAAVQQ